MSRPLNEHIDNAELDALMPTGTSRALDGPSLEIIREIRQHVRACPEWSGKVQRYWLFVSQDAPEVRVLPLRLASRMHAGGSEGSRNDVQDGESAM